MGKKIMKKPRKYIDLSSKLKIGYVIYSHSQYASYRAKLESSSLKLTQKNVCMNNLKTDSIELITAQYGLSVAHLFTSSLLLLSRDVYIFFFFWSILRLI